MSEEIKEIFYKLKSDDYYEEHYQQSVYYERDLKKLENYITNLQKELEKKDVYIKYLEEYNPKYYKGKIFYGDGREDYKQRNEKAVEYIEERKNLNWYADGVFVYELLNILNGGDE